MREKRFEESYHAFMTILQKEKEYSYQNPSHHEIFVEIAESYFYIGILLDLLGQSQDAIINLIKALKIRQRKLDNNHMDIAWTYFNLGIIKGKIGNINSAISDLEACILIQRRNAVSSSTTDALLKQYELLRIRAAAA